MAAAGICGKVLGFIRAFLAGRTYRVRINESFSSDYPVETSVPQGSVLGPLLFLIYINDLPSYIPAQLGIKLYADDVKLYYAHSSDDTSEALHAANCGLERWSIDWLVSIAANKCAVLYLGKKNKRTRYSLNGQLLPAADSIRDLGVIVDNKLAFSEQVSKVVKTAYFKAFQLLKILRTRTLSTLIFAYKVYVRPHLEYAVEAWSPKKISDIRRLEKVQRYYTRIAFRKCGLQKTTYADRLRTCELESLEYRRKIADLAMVYKILKNKVSLDHSKYFLRSSRNRFNRFQLQKRRHSSKTDSNFFIRTINAWNQLPDEIVAVSTVKTFIRKIKDFNLYDPYLIT